MFFYFKSIGMFSNTLAIREGYLQLFSLNRNLIHFYKETVYILGHNDINK